MPRIKSSTKASELRYEHIAPDAKQNWLNLTDNDWDTLLPVADKATKGKSSNEAIFKLFSNGIVSARDDWTTDFSEINLKTKVTEFSKIYTQEIARWKLSKEYADLQNEKSVTKKKAVLSKFVSREIKWTSELEAHLFQFNILKFNSKRICVGSDRPFIKMHTYFDKIITHRIYQQNHIFPIKTPEENKVLCFSGLSSSKPFQALASEYLPSFDLLEKTQCLPRYRYNTEGERIDNITDWALEQFQKAYADLQKNPSSVLRTRSNARGEGKTSAVLPSPLEGEGAPRGADEGYKPITKDAIFHYVYGVLHDPIYRTKYAQNLKRDFPRVPFYPDFWQWAAWGEQLMALHIGYETQEPWPLTRLDVPNERALANGVAPTPKLKSDPLAGIIILDTETQLTGIPKEAWEYRLGNRSALDWILDQHKEKTPKDPTIREKFNTYKFADYKEKVVDLIARVTRVSVETITITTAMRELKRNES